MITRRACLGMMLVSGSALLSPSTALARRRWRRHTDPPPPPPPPPPTTTGHQYFLDSVAGSDSSAGTSVEQAWRSLAPLNARQLLPGDSVYFKRGSTWGGGLRLDDSGQNGHPITYTAYGSGALPTFTNSGVSSGHAITVSGSWIVLEQVLARDAYEGGVYLAPGASYNVVRQVETTNVGLGIFIRGQHNLITANHIHDLKMVVSNSGGDNDYGAVGVWIAESDNEISYNTLERCKASSYDYGVDGGAIELYGTVNRTFIHHNMARDCEGFLEVGGGEELDTVVAYNLIRDTSRALHFNLGAVRYASAVDRFRFENNTVVQTSGGYRPINFISGSLAGSQLTVRNNVFSGFRVLAQSTGFIHDHNLYSSLDAGALVLGNGELVATPGFVNAGAGNYRLSAGSPAINRGVTLGYTVDLDGTPVPAAGAPDLGAYEYH